VRECTAEETGDIATSTNADIFKKILDFPILGGLGENLTQLPADCGFMSIRRLASSVSRRYRSVKKTNTQRPLQRVTLRGSENGIAAALLYRQKGLSLCSYKKPYT
jgi:hypothetical protein